MNSWLLLVGTDSNPDVEVKKNLFQEWMSENSDEFFVILIAGIIIGIGISFVYTKIRNYLKNKKGE